MSNRDRQRKSLEKKWRRILNSKGLGKAERKRGHFAEGLDKCG